MILRNITVKFIFCFLGLLFGLNAVGLATTGERFELRGRIRDSDNNAIKKVIPSVTLYSVNSPFESRTLIGPGGEFKFKKLEIGGYRLRFVVPGWGVMEKSVEIGPSFADRKRRIHKEFVFQPEYSTDQIATVSTGRLSVSQKSWKEFENAKKELGKKNTEKAIQHLEKAVEDSPGFAIALNRLGTIFYHQRDFTKAEDYFTRALNGDPDAYSPLVNLCAVQFALRKINESLECNQKAVAKEPGDPLAHSQLGRSYFVLGQYDLAVTELNEAKKLDSGHFSYPQLVLAEIYRIRGDDTNQIREIEEFLIHHPDVGFVPQLRQLIESKKKKSSSPIPTP